MQLVTCTYETHADAILGILNEVIASSTALFDYHPRPPESMAAWFAAKANGRFPVIGAMQNDRLLGFATYGVFRAWPAYKYSVEHSVYIASGERGKGIGRALLQRLIAVAEEQGYHTLVAGIDASNAASIALHEKLGFAFAGTVVQAGFKFGRWLDLSFYQLVLPTPRQPVDG
jgi:phosphinothricin acetyltransferase